MPRLRSLHTWREGGACGEETRRIGTVEFEVLQGFYRAWMGCFRELGSQSGHHEHQLPQARLGGQAAKPVIMSISHRFWGLGSQTDHHEHQLPQVLDS